jgi:uncharacterized protein
MTTITLTELNIYPIKSAAGIAVSQATVEARGLQFDRRWMVVDAQGKFMTQRKLPQMALIRVAVNSAGLTIDAPGMPRLELPICPEQAEPCQVEIWGDNCTALSMGHEAKQWLSDFLGQPCQLVYMPDNSQRPIDHGKLGDQTWVSFADAYPFLLISEATLADLNARLESPVPMNRFRPNLVIRGCDAFAEDEWQQIRIGEIVFDVAKPCARCSIPSVEQTTGECGKEPLITLAKYRLRNGEILFGQNLVQANLGLLQIGDIVEILEIKE